MKNTPILVWGIIGAALIAAVGFAIFASSQLQPATNWEGTAIACISGHDGLGQHIHPELSIMVDGAPEMIPASIGISPKCMAEVHTHESDGVIHIESVEPGKTFTLGDFFTVAATSINRDGYTLEATVNGTSTPDVASYVLKDADKIVLAYKKVQ